MSLSDKGDSAPVDAFGDAQRGDRGYINGKPSSAAYCLRPVGWLETARKAAREEAERLAYEAQLEAEAAEWTRLSASDRRAINSELRCIETAPGGSRLVGNRKYEPEGEAAAAGSPTATPAAGAEPSITAPASSQSVKASGGLDWLDVSLYVTWNAKAWKELRACLEWAKKERQEDRFGYLPHPEDGLPCPVEPDGMRHGPRGAGVFCPWQVVAFPDVELHIADAVAPGDSGRPNIFLHIGAKAFLSVGGLYWYYEVIRFLSLLGATIEKSVISRVDGCVDLPEVDPQELLKPCVEFKWVSRARKGRPDFEGREWTGFTLGRGSLVRIYDKLREVKNDQEKLSLMRQRRWGGVIPSKAVRVEFQLRNDELRENYGISSVEDFEQKGAALFQLLSHSWFRITSEVPDKENKHQSRAKTAPVWEQVQEAFAVVFNHQGETLDKPIRVYPDSSRLRSQIGGCISSQIVTQALGTIQEAEEFVKNTCESFENFAEYVVKFLAPIYRDVKERAVEKLWEFRAKRVSSAVGTIAKGGSVDDWEFGGACVGLG